MEYILVIFTTIVFSSSGTGYEKDWRPIGEFSKYEKCRTAAREMGLSESRYRCLQK